MYPYIFDQGVSKHHLPKLTMKKIIFAIFYLISPVLLSAQIADEIQVTRNPADVKGLLKICTINETTAAPFTGQAKLREKAIAKAKKTAALKGANIILIELDNFEMTPINNINIVGAAYLSKSIKEDQATSNAVDMANCDDVKQELKIYKEKYGDLRTTQSTIVNNLDNGVEFNLLSVEGDKLNQTLTVNFYLFTRKTNQSIQLLLKGSTDTKATDLEGNQFAVKAGALGDLQEDSYLTSKLSTEVKLKGFVKYSNVLPSTKQMSLISIYMSSKNFDSGQNEAKGTIDIKNADIIWK